VGDMRIFVGNTPAKVVKKAAEITADEIAKRTGSRPSVVESAQEGRGDIVLEVSTSIKDQAFVIDVDLQKGVCITGGDARGVLYGCGRMMRRARFEPGKMIPGPSEGVNEPALEIRGIYFASHFGNFYDRAPVAEVNRYIEELALWGYNRLIVWFDMHHFTGIDDPKARLHLDRLRSFHQAARNVGMKVGLILLANEAYSTSPANLRADPNTGHAHYKVEYCPSKPGGIEAILQGLREEFDQFKHLDILWIWPYDQGGCACEQCRPWGANGFVKAARAISEEIRGRFPDCQIILSTWYFDCPGDQGEWAGLYRELEKDSSWIDGVLGDGAISFPAHPLKHKLPGGLPLVNFPEISMQGMVPWGGFGANPRPAHWRKIWDELRPHIQGGFPYSEGIYEDINKIIWARAYWGSDCSVMDTVTEYVAYEFSPDLAERIGDVMAALETTLYRYGLKIKSLDGAGDIWKDVEDINAQLPEWAASGWRWRLIYLRARIDAELEKNDLKPTEAVHDSIGEITEIYHAHDAEPLVKPDLEFS